MRYLSHPMRWHYKTPIPKWWIFRLFPVSFPSKISAAMTLLVHTHEISGILVFSLSELLQLSAATTPADATIILPLDYCLSLLTRFPSPPWPLQLIPHPAEIPLKHKPGGLLFHSKPSNGFHLVSTKVHYQYQDIYGPTIWPHYLSNVISITPPWPALFPLHWLPCIPLIHQVQWHLRIFVITIPSAWNIFPSDCHMT